MYAQVEKLKENKRQSVVNTVFQKKKDNKPTFQFADNRPEFTQMRKLQGMTNSNHHAIPLRAFNDKVSENCQQKNNPFNNRLDSPIQRIKISSSTFLTEVPHELDVEEAMNWIEAPSNVNKKQLQAFLDSSEDTYSTDEKLKFISDYENFVSKSKNYTKTGEDLTFGRRTISLDDSDSSKFDIKFKEAMNFIREAKDLSNQVARLLIYTKEAIEYSDEQRDSTYTTTSLPNAAYDDTTFTGELGELLSNKATICREKSAFAQVLLSELGIHSVAVYGESPSDAHAWLEIPEAKAKDREFGRVDPTWGKAGKTLREEHNREFTERMDYANGQATLTKPKYAVDGEQMVETIKEVEQILQNEGSKLEEALKEYLAKK